MIKNNIFNRYLEIKQDLLSNLSEVFKRSHYYTHKYRGNVLLDLNVGLSESDSGNKRIQIFIRAEGHWIRDVFIYNSKGIVESNVTSNFLYNVEE